MDAERVKILLVEDNKGFAFALQEALAITPRFQVQHAATLRDALAHLAGNNTDVVLLDLSLPDREGMAVIQEVRKCAPEVPVIVLTGFDDRSMAVQALKEGALDYLVKGQVDAALLERSIDNASQRRRMEEALRQYHEQQAQHVLELQAVNEELQAVNQELEAFSYSVSHDLRAPLRHITGFGEILVEEATTLSEDGRRYVGVIVDAARHMSRLIEDLLSFSRMSRSEVRKADVGLDELVGEAWREALRDAGSRRIEFQAADLGRVYADPSLLKMVMVNLLANAVKYSRPQEHARVEVGRLAGEGGDTVIFVRDNGVGFDMEYAGKLFGVFQRLHSADQFEGTGIGLANVRRIIHRHGGRTWAEGAPGQGATFYLSLPAPAN